MRLSLPFQNESLDLLLTLPAKPAPSLSLSPNHGSKQFCLSMCVVYVPAWLVLSAERGERRGEEAYLVCLKRASFCGGAKKATPALEFEILGLESRSLLARLMMYTLEL